MNITGLLLPLALAPTILKYIKRTSNGTVTVTPPTAKVGERPNCGIGRKAVFFENPDRWVCVVDFD